MKNKAILFVLMSGLLLMILASCSKEAEKWSTNEGSMDSLSVAERTKDEQTLSILKEKKEATELKADRARANTKEAEGLERDAIDAAEQAEEALQTEEKAQRSRRQADVQAIKAEKASNKSDDN